MKPDNNYDGSSGHRQPGSVPVDLNDLLLGLAERLRVDLLQTGSNDPHARDSRQTDDDPNGAQGHQSKTDQTFANVQGWLSDGLICLGAMLGCASWSWLAVLESQAGKRSAEGDACRPCSVFWWWRRAG
jgi:hypothetical protein